MAPITSYDDYYKKYLSIYAPQRDQEIADSDAVFNKQLATIEDLYAGRMADSNAQYDALEQQNAVQRFINEQQVAENNANLGVTDSGLNRTQQTAVQLSASNNAAKIARQRQSMVDSLTREVTALKSDIEINRSNAKTAIQDKYTQLASSNAQISHQADVDYANQQAKIAADKEVALAQAAAKNAETSQKAYSDLVSAFIKDEMSDDQKKAAFRAYGEIYGFDSVQQAQQLLSYSGLNGTVDQYGNVTFAVENATGNTVRDDGETRTKLGEFHIVNEVLNPKNWAAKTGGIWFAGTRKVYSEYELKNALKKEFGYSTTDAAELAGRLYYKVKPVENTSWHTYK